MNFYYEPLPAAQLAAWNKYMCPVLGAETPMRFIDPSLATEKFVFPTPGVLRNGYYFKLLTPEQNAVYNGAYATAVGL
jgi:spermidine/putrescine transport system substrate-binding protein